MSAIEELLDKVRSTLPPRPGPADLEAIWAGGGLVVDTRPQSLRDRDGSLPGALVVERNVLEWRLDPTSPWRLPEVTHHDQQVVVLCDEGYASSLAAASLQALGLRRATDLDGGYQAWLRWSNGSNGAASVR
jgi:rhodanese-related sulfurtransferase